jgi:ATP-dependent protease HslVU (ClpYQ) peptidase subunit
MTCIVAIGDGERVWIGGDSAGVAGYAITVRADVKVFENGPMVFGFTESFRMGQLLRYSFTPPKHYDGDDMHYLVTLFIDAVRQCFKDKGWARTDNGVERGGQFLIGYRGNVYQVDGDFQVGWPTGNVAAVGCGEEFAFGSLFSSSGSPEKRITEALRAAEHYSAGVVGPFTIVSGGAS